MGGDASLVPALGLCCVFGLLHNVSWMLTSLSSLLRSPSSPLPVEWSYAEPRGAPSVRTRHGIQTVGRAMIGRGSCSWSVRGELAQSAWVRRLLGRTMFF